MPNKHPGCPSTGHTWGYKGSMTTGWTCSNHCCKKYRCPRSSPCSLAQCTTTLSTHTRLCTMYICSQNRCTPGRDCCRGDTWYRQCSHIDHLCTSCTYSPTLWCTRGRCTFATFRPAQTPYGKTCTFRGIPCTWRNCRNIGSSPARRQPARTGGRILCIVGSCMLRSLE